MKREMIAELRRRLMTSPPWNKPASIDLSKADAAQLADELADIDHNPALTRKILFDRMMAGTAKFMNIPVRITE